MIAAQVAAAIGAGEQPGLAAERDAEQGALGGIVAEADAAVVDKTGQCIDALVHVVHRLAEGLLLESLARSRLIHSIRS